MAWHHVLLRAGHGRLEDLGLDVRAGDELTARRLAREILGAAADVVLQGGH